MLNWLFDLIENVGGWLNIAILIALLILGFFCLIKGADIFVGNSSDLAKKLGISSLVIGLTIVSFGTSMPEASVSITAAINNSSDLSISNVVGSNIFNFLVVLGSSLIFGKIVINKMVIKRDMPIMIISAILLLLFIISYGTGNYSLARIEGIILLVVFVLYLILMFKTSKPENENTEKKNVNIAKCILLLCLGLLLIVAGGELVTYSAKTCAIKLGVSELIVGLTIVAIGTSLPELITSIVAAKKNENEIAIGNVVGSNIFNVLFILGASATISPLNVSKIVIVDIIVFVSISLLALLYFTKKSELHKKDGIIFIIVYAIYLTYIILREIL